jgi:hypothetical protein
VNSARCRLGAVAESTTTESGTTTIEDNGGVEPEPGDDRGGDTDGAGSGGSLPEDTPQSTSEDTPQHDVTPPPDTPQGKFERYCNQNPGACG